MSARKRPPAHQRRSLAEARHNKMRRNVNRGLCVFMIIVILSAGIAFAVNRKLTGVKTFADEYPAAFTLISLLCGVLMGFFLYTDYRKKHPHRSPSEDDDEEKGVSRKARRNAARKKSFANSRAAGSPRLYPLMNTKSETEDDANPVVTRHSAHT